MKKGKGARPVDKRRTGKTTSTHEDFITSAAPPGKPARKEQVALGERIQVVREMRGLSIEDISSRTGITILTLKSIEANKILPPLGQLIKLGKALDMKMGYFLSAGVEKPMTVVRKGRGQAVARYGGRKSKQHGYTYESLAPEKANRMMEPFIVTLMPADISESSTHDGQEFIYVLEGDMEAKVGDVTELLHPGDAIYYDSSQPHLVKAAGKTKTTILAVLYTGAK